MADRGLKMDSKGRALRWLDGSGEEHHARQGESGRRPRLIKDAIAGHPALRFSGEGDYLSLEGEVVSSQ